MRTASLIVFIGSGKSKIIVGFTPWWPEMFRRRGDSRRICFPEIRSDAGCVVAPDIRTG